MHATFSDIEASIADSERYLQARESRISSDLRLDSLDVSPVNVSFVMHAAQQALQQLLAERDSRWPASANYSHRKIGSEGIMQQLVDERDRRRLGRHNGAIHEEQRREYHPEETAQEAREEEEVTRTPRNGRKGEIPKKKTINANEFNGKVDLWLRTHARERHRRMAEKEERERAANKCSFTPKISTRSRKLVEGTRPTTPRQLADRLHSEAQRRGALREKELQNKAARELEGYTFRPAVRPSRVVPHPNDRIPIEQRQQLHKERLQLRRREAEAEIRKEATFTPKLNNRSLRMLERRRAHGTQFGGSNDSALVEATVNLPVEERLLRGRGAGRGEGTARDADEIGDQLTADERKRRIRRFMERQEQFAHASSAKASIEAALPDAECTFKPAINPVSVAITAGESPRSRAHRIECVDAKRRQEKQELLRSQEPQECTFRPKLNTRSRELTASRPQRNEVYERLYQDAARLNENRENACDVSGGHEASLGQRRQSSYQHIRSHYNFSDPTRLMTDIQKEQQRRQQKIEAKRQERQADELRECTSTMSSCSAAPGGPILVSGLNRYMEYRERAAEARLKEKQIQQASTMRAESQPKEWAPTLTVPQPFNFTSRGSRRAPQEKGYSFHPTTNEARRREAVHRALSSDGLSDLMDDQNDDLNEFSFEGFAVAIASLSTGVCLAVALSHLSMHARKWVAPEFQVYIARIILLVPIYSLCAWASVLHPSKRYAFALIRDAYEAYALYMFMVLNVNYLGGARRLLLHFDHGHRVHWLWPLCWFMPKPMPLDDKLLWILRTGCIQFVILKPLSSVAVLLCHGFGIYTEDTLDNRVAFLTLTAIVNTSVSLAIYSLGMLYRATREMLDPFGPFPKFLLIKFIVFFPWAQNTALMLLVELGLIRFNSSIPNVRKSLVVLEETLTCIEMAVVACIFVIAFPVDRLWAPIASARTNFGADRSRWHAPVKDIMQQKDFLNDVMDTLKPWSDLESAAVRLIESHQSKPHSGTEVATEDVEAGQNVMIDGSALEASRALGEKETGCITSLAACPA
ncbi:hypothetical protein FOL47_011207 [Perkinsus chesapeaki]|uniref:Transmembrane protein n=1 Tax=Perkinsus chesapeaki TaxID=330153 RepID=A0A7J6MMV9_PERCH|nr:hypothetical protein FOL47_011207 [Perkinsus chesapeaki]